MASGGTEKPAAKVLGFSEVSPQILCVLNGLDHVLQVYCKLKVNYLHQKSWIENSDQGHDHSAGVRTAHRTHFFKRPHDHYHTQKSSIFLPKNFHLKNKRKRILGAEIQVDWSRWTLFLWSVLYCQLCCWQTNPNFSYIIHFQSTIHLWVVHTWSQPYTYIFCVYRKHSNVVGWRQPTSLKVH